MVITLNVKIKSRMLCDLVDLQIILYNEKEVVHNAWSHGSVRKTDVKAHEGTKS